MSPLLQALVSRLLSPDPGQALAVPVPGLAAGHGLISPPNFIPSSVRDCICLPSPPDSESPFLSPMRFGVDVTSAFPMSVLFWFLSCLSRLHGHPPAPLSGSHPSLHGHIPLHLCQYLTRFNNRTSLHEGRSLSLRVLSVSLVLLFSFLPEYSITTGR